MKDVVVVTLVWKYCNYLNILLISIYFAGHLPHMLSVNAAFGQRWPGRWAPSSTCWRATASPTTAPSPCSTPGTGGRSWSSTTSRASSTTPSGRPSWWSGSRMRTFWRQLEQPVIKILLILIQSSTQILMKILTSGHQESLVTPTVISSWPGSNIAARPETEILIVVRIYHWSLNNLLINFCFR